MSFLEKISENVNTSSNKIAGLFHLASVLTTPVLMAMLLKWYALIWASLWVVAFLHFLTYRDKQDLTLIESVSFSFGKGLTGWVAIGLGVISATKETYIESKDQDAKIKKLLEESDKLALEESNCWYAAFFNSFDSYESDDFTRIHKHVREHFLALKNRKEEGNGEISRFDKELKGLVDVLGEYRDLALKDVGTLLKSAPEPATQPREQRKSKDPYTNFRFKNPAMKPFKNLSESERALVQKVEDLYQEVKDFPKFSESLATSIWEKGHSLNNIHKYMLAVLEDTRPPEKLLDTLVTLEQKVEKLLPVAEKCEPYGENRHIRDAYAYLHSSNGFAKYLTSDLQKKLQDLNSLYADCVLTLRTEANILKYAFYEDMRNYDDVEAKAKQYDKFRAVIFSEALTDDPTRKTAYRYCHEVLGTKRYYGEQDEVPILPELK